MELAKRAVNPRALIKCLRNLGTSSEVTLLSYFVDSVRDVVGQDGQSAK